jgi:hypothetical protein
MATIKEESMASVTGAIYEPPSDDLPYLAVLLHNGEVVASKAFKSPEAGTAFLATIVPQLQAKNRRGPADNQEKES